VPLIECIPNVSEGRRAEVIDACSDAIRSAGAALLDVHVDPDHHRSVFSFAGEVREVEAAALALVDTALERIDLRAHAGVHPRMGAVDVMPFVPLGAVTLETCAAVARGIGNTVAARHGLPVYLYEAAALDSSRRHLEDVRRGGFEGLSLRMAAPGLAPDFGPRTPHPSAGAIAIGARGPLVAFNVVLDTKDVGVARSIARAVRARDGGLPAVKALGLWLESQGLAQVSLNLVDYRVTPPVVVFDRIVDEARHFGVSVLESELVGLVPRAALPSDPRSRLRLGGPPRVYALEDALARAGRQLS
jgi:glutamate formiminotransferase